jgi:hypothetical protein
MPTTYVDSPPPPPENPDDLLVFLLAGNIGPSPFQVLDQAFFLRLFDRIFPDNYITPIRESGEGYELFKAMAAVGERASQAQVNNAESTFISWAKRGAFATCTEVAFSRANAGAGAGVVKAGTKVKTSKGGRRFILTTDLAFGIGDVGPHTAMCRAEATGWEYNVQGPRVTAAGETIPGEIDTVDELITDPVFWDHTITCANLVDASGGAGAMLEELGIERGTSMRDGESEEMFRARLRQLPDTVSPLAIMRSVYFYLSQLNVPFVYIEPYGLDYQTCWDGPTITKGNYKPNVFVLDDPRSEYPFRNRWMSEDDCAGSFIILVPNLQCFGSMAMVCDDPGLTVTDFSTKGRPGWRRGFDACDLPQNWARGPAACDGVDQKRRAAYGGLNDLIQRIKSGGYDGSLEICLTEIKPPT